MVFWFLALVLGESETHSWPGLGRKKRWVGRKDDVFCLDPLSLRAVKC